MRAVNRRSIMCPTLLLLTVMSDKSDASFSLAELPYASVSIPKLLAETPVLCDLPFADIATLTNLFGALKNDIILTQSSSTDDTSAPMDLPPAIIDFLSDAMHLSAETICNAWSILRDEVWYAPSPTLSAVEKMLFHEHGAKRGLSERFILISYL
uniref:Uncharacterized protein n=1 Tax=Mycena chlorophos TaxID=658473 RepID=A0ABQ0L5C6_MYCCL|nr:predicted protein [Mycena chlorophos]